MYSDQEQKITIRNVKIGAWRYPCAICLLPEDEAQGFRRLQQNEAKAEQREARCRLPDGTGGFIRCPEENRCRECTRCLSFRHDNGHPTSYEALQELYDDAEAEYYRDGEEAPATMPDQAAGEEAQPEEVYLEMMQILVDRLTKIRPKYGKVFQELLKGNTKPLSIARTLGIGKSQIYDDIPRIQELAKKLYFQLRDE